MQTCPNCQTRNAEGQKFCGNCGLALAPANTIAGERKFATFLFADVAHSTAIAERLDPEDWTVIMNGAFGFMNAAVSKYGGTVSRLMGDAVLALFGAPVAHEDDAERAVRAGLEIQEAAKAYAREVKQRHGFDFDLRVGINTGTAVLAMVGDAIRSEYTAMGDAANVAARLQSAADPGTVLISADTHRLVASLFDFKPRGAIEMKGKQVPVACYEVLGTRAIPGRSRGLEGLASPLVGRERETALLREKLAALEQGVGCVVAITGEAGLGKSRLVAELRAIRDAQPQGRIQWFESRAISYGQSIPYYPWRQLGRQVIGATDMDAAPAVRREAARFRRSGGPARRQPAVLRGAAGGGRRGQPDGPRASGGRRRGQRRRRRRDRGRPGRDPFRRPSAAAGARHGRSALVGQRDAGADRAGGDARQRRAAAGVVPAAPGSQRRQLAARRSPPGQPRRRIRAHRPRAARPRRFGRAARQAAADREPSRERQGAHCRAIGREPLLSRGSAALAHRWRAGGA